MYHPAADLGDTAACKIYCYVDGIDRLEFSEGLVGFLMLIVERGEKM